MKAELYNLRRGSLLLFFVFLFHSLVFSQQVAKSIPYPASPDGVIGFLQFTPPDYGTQQHPLIIFLHGIGERGNGTSQINYVANNGTPNYCAHGATMRFTVNGQTSSFVVLSPQLSTQYGYWPTFYVKEMINYAKANLQIDPNRIYVTGLSLGGGGIWRLITDTYNFDHTFDGTIAAAAPVCGTQEETDADFCSTIGANHLPVWAFHCMDDGTVGVGATQHAEILANMCGLSPAAKFTYYQSGGHGGAWLNAYDTGHITRTLNTGASFTANPNLYEWFLSNTRSAAPPANTPPVANAGTAQAITLPLTTVTLSGSGAGTNGATISSYSWAKASGPAGGAISLPLLNTTVVTGLLQGTYVYTLTVTDNHGLTNSSNVTVTVNPPANQSPVSNAGSNISITLPTSNTTLNGTASNDPDGTISSYLWTKTSGPASYNIANTTSATTALNNLVQGIYVFNLKVTDNAGATANSSVTVTVNAAPNQPPVANAGGNTNISLPTNNATLNGTASSDPDGTISTYLWTKSSGPASYAIANSGAASTTVSNLVQGVYVFNLQVTDNAGATATSSVMVTVNAAANQSPVSNAGSNTAITLPLSDATLNGSASNDPDGTISNYAWTKTSGPASYTIANPAAASTTVSNLTAGVYVFTLTVTDNAGATASSTVTVTVNGVVAPPPVNQPPVAKAGSDIAITLPVSNATLNGTASTDADGTINTYAWTKTSGPASYNIADAAAATTAVSNLAQGVYIFTLTVTDNAGATATSNVTITVNAAVAPPPPANQPPVANAGSDIAITLPVSNTTLNGSASTDADGTISTYAWTKTSGPSSYNIADAAAATSVINNLTQGVYVFTLTVTDNAGATASSNVTITVNAAVAPPPPANQPPVANAGSDITITLPVSNTTLNGSASTDADGTISTYAWTKTSGPSSYNLANAAAATTAVSNLTEGAYVFTLAVTDNAGATATSTVTVTVSAATPPPPPVNKAPVANAGPNVNLVLPSNSTTLDGSASSDPDGNINSYAWSKISGPASYTLGSTGAASTSLSNLTEGVYVFTLQVTDNLGATASSNVTVTVNKAPNKSPLANAGADIAITLPVNSADLNGAGSSDPDGTVSSYSWNKLSGRGAVSIVNSNSAAPTAVGLAEGQYVFELTITDNDGATATDQVTVTVNPRPNQAPVADAGKDSSIALPLTAATLSGTNSADPDGSINGYSWKQVSGPSAAVIAQATSAATGISGLLEGDYVFELTVTDNAGATGTARVKMSVLNNFRYSEFFKLYPNPASNVVNLQFIDDKTGKLGIGIYDVNGRLVINEEFSKDQSLVTKQIEVSKLKPGMYYLEIRHSDGTKMTRPFVKQ